MVTQAHTIYGANHPRAYLIRPDGHLSFAGRPDDPTALAAHLDRYYLPRER